MDWEQEILKLIKFLNPQVVLIVGLLAEMLKRSVWHSLGWSKAYFWLVPLILSFPATYLFSLSPKMSWQLFVKNSLLTGCLIILIFERFVEPILGKYFKVEVTHDGGH